MAYELACPACAHKVLSPFVRVGAVVLCPRCSAKYRIADEHVRRATGAPKPAEAVVKAAEEEAESSARQLSDGSMAGLSGLSALMEAEPDLMPAEAQATEPPPVARPVAGPVTPRARHAQRDVRRRNARALYFLAGLLGLAMAALGGGLWWAVVSDRDVALPPPTADELPLSPEDAATLSALPLLTAEAMPELTWELIKERHRYSDRGRDPYLRDEARVFADDGGEFYTATVTSDGPGIVVAATLRLVLIDMSDHAVARGTIPLAYFGNGRQQKVRVSFPPEVPTGRLRVDSWVDIQKRLPEAAYLTNPDVRPVSPGARTLLRLKAINRDGRTLYGAQVSLRALDEGGGTIARYVLQYPWPIESGMQMALRVAVPPPGPAQPPASWVADIAASATP